MYARVFSQSSNTEEWIKQFEEANCASHAIRQVLSQHQIKNIKKLYKNFTQLPPDFRIDIKESWQLLCLSGEEGVFNEVKKVFADYMEKILEKNRSLEEQEALLDDNSRDKEKNSIKIAKQEIEEKSKALYDNDMLLFCAIMSGDPEQLKNVLDLMKENNVSAPLNKTLFKNLNVLHLAILSGSVEQVNFILQAAEEDKIQFQSRNSKGYCFIHFAAASGSLEMLKRVMEFDNVKQVDSYGFTALDYAIVKNDEASTAFLKEQGLSAADHHHDFYFGGLTQTSLAPPRP